MDTQPKQPTPHPSRSALAVTGLALCCAIVWALIIQTGSLGFPRPSFDAHMFHLPTTRVIAEYAPDVPWDSLRSATTPGYHIALAAASAVTPDYESLRLWGMCFALGAVLVLGIIAGRGLDSFRTVCCILPFATSIYITEAAVHIVPDAAAWLWVTASLGILLLAPAKGWRLYILGAALALTAITRQIHLWVCGVAVFSAWADAVHGSQRPTWLLEQPIQRAQAALITCAAAVPAFAIVAAFIAIWGGPVPELFRTDSIDPMQAEQAVNNTGLSLATPSATLIIIFLYGIFFLPTWSTAFARTWPKGQRRSIVGLIVIWSVIGFVLSVAEATTYDTTQGRFGGFWILGKIGPAIYERSLAITLVTMLGAVTLGFILAMLDRRSRWIFAISILGFWSSHIIAAFAWQRYIEPLVLILLACTSSGIHRRWGSPNVAWFGPAFLAIAFVSLSASRITTVQDWQTYQWPDPEVSAYYQTESHRTATQEGLDLDAANSDSLEQDAPAP